MTRRTTRRPPPAVVPIAGLAVVFFALPLLGLLLRVPWSDLGSHLGAPAVRQALWLSIVCSLWATALCLVAGIPLAWVLARVEFPGKALVRGLATLPMVLPPVVGGVALLFAFGRRGLVGRWLHEAFGVQLPFSTAGVVLAETFVAMPFLVVTAEAGLRSLDQRFEEAAATLGAGRWTAFRRVTLPLVAPSILAGTVLAWARALGEFGATITFAGSFEDTTRTMPLAVFLALEESDPQAAVVLSLVLLAVSLTVLVALRGRWARTTQ